MRYKRNIKDLSYDFNDRRNRYFNNPLKNNWITYEGDHLFDLFINKTIKNFSIDNYSYINILLDNGFEFYLHNDEFFSYHRTSDIVGDIENLKKAPIVSAYISYRIARKEEISDYSGTWTFFRISNVVDTIVIGILGQSNGFYREDIFVERIM